MSMYISTDDFVVGNWVISTGYGVVGYVAVDLYRGRCGRERVDRFLGRRFGRLWFCRSLLGTVW